jgi:hypothetical protein
MTTTDENEIEDNLLRIYTIINSEIFELKNINHPLRKSAFIEMMICLRDLAYKCNKYNIIVNFSDDIVQSEKIQNISDLIKYIRDACCHIDSSNNRYLDSGSTFSFNTLYGKTNLLGIENSYEDDICFCFGEQKIYLKRHIIRYLEESIASLKEKMSLLPAEWKMIFEKRYIC